MTTEPPSNVVQAAVNAARRTDCAKSRRGVAIYGSTVDLLAVGYNHRPDGPCRNTEGCKRDCTKVCIHAEQHALKLAIFRLNGAPPRHEPFRLKLALGAYDLVHVKISPLAGDLLPGGGPSCWQCSKAIQDAGVAGVWLYLVGDSGLVTSPYRTAGAGWRRYTADEFHRITLAECGLEP